MQPSPCRCPTGSDCCHPSLPVPLTRPQRRPRCGSSAGWALLSSFSLLIRQELLRLLFLFSAGLLSWKSLPRNWEHVEPPAQERGRTAVFQQRWAIPAVHAVKQKFIPSPFTLTALVLCWVSFNTKRSLGVKYKKQEGLSIQPAIPRANGRVWTLGAAVPETPTCMYRRTKKARFDSDTDSAQINGKTLSLNWLNERAFKKRNRALL